MSYPHCSCINKQAKRVNATFKMKNKGSIKHLASDSTGLKVYGAKWH
ncbi:Mobile element protein [Candidatus Enterovibrio altilux]|uniref:Mobile element protein n=1 Tax=Candidatus Enterovibrio altilux TaxID=1927128 RepID=A0A291B851_9GAMM|nr:Mobile element protein [Candidatus Enterovibrio luxaltus]